MKKEKARLEKEACDIEIRQASQDFVGDLSVKTVHNVELKQKAKKSVKSRIVEDIEKSDLRIIELQEKVNELMNDNEDLTAHNHELEKHIQEMKNKQLKERSQGEEEQAQALKEQ